MLGCARCLASCTFWGDWIPMKPGDPCCWGACAGRLPLWVPQCTGGGLLYVTGPTHQHQWWFNLYLWLWSLLDAEQELEVNLPALYLAAGLLWWWCEYGSWIQHHNTTTTHSWTYTTVHHTITTCISILHTSHPSLSCAFASLLVILVLSDRNRVSGVDLTA